MYNDSGSGGYRGKENIVSISAYNQTDFGSEVVPPGFDFWIDNLGNDFVDNIGNFIDFDP